MLRGTSHRVCLYVTRVIMLLHRTLSLAHQLMVQRVVVSKPGWVREERLWSGQGVPWRTQVLPTSPCLLWKGSVLHQDHDVGQSYVGNRVADHIQSRIVLPHEHPCDAAHLPLPCMGRASFNSWGRIGGDPGCPPGQGGQCSPCVCVACVRVCTCRASACWWTQLMCSPVWNVSLHREGHQHMPGSLASILAITS